ncbi:MAG: hypothetical protein IJB98_03185 [Clostridia bacterium]|nr:hypothetical protein [Clostridia bacterium]
MEKIPSSLIGYNKQCVDDIINQKDNCIITQKQDINYLRNEVERLEKRIKESEKNKIKN